jgi:hypothetical protein
MSDANLAIERAVAIPGQGLARERAEIVIIPGATHLFEEPRTLEKVALLASASFGKHLGEKRAALCAMR